MLGADEIEFVPAPAARWRNAAISCWLASSLPVRYAFSFSAWASAASAFAARFSVSAVLPRCWAPIVPSAGALTFAGARAASQRPREALSLSGRSGERKTPRVREKSRPARSSFRGLPQKSPILFAPQACLLTTNLVKKQLRFRQPEPDPCGLLVSSAVQGTTANTPGNRLFLARRGDGADS